MCSLIFETGHIKALSDISWAGAGSIIYTGLISTVLAFAIWGRLFQKYSPNVVAPFSLLLFFCYKDLNLLFQPTDEPCSYAKRQILGTVRGN
jgi:hypothetical protein